MRFHAAALRIVIGDDMIHEGVERLMAIIKEWGLWPEDLGAYGWLYSENLFSPAPEGDRWRPY